jgi:hypothetical protein
VRKKTNHQKLAACAAGGVTIVLVGLSLNHLAHGIGIVTGSGVEERWAMAIGIDLGFVVLEMSQLCSATETVRRQVSRYATPAIIGTLVISAALNALAFVAAAPVGLAQYAAGALGVVIPALIYCLSRITFTLATTNPRSTSK